MKAMSAAPSPVSMMTPESEAGSFAPGSPRLEGQDCRLMVRHLLSRFSRREIEQLLEEEGSEPSSYGPQPGVPGVGFDGSYVAMLSEGMPAAAGMVRFPGPRQQQAPMPAATRAVAAGRSSSSAGSGSGSSSSASSSTPYRTDYACGFCAEIGITKTCTRRNDLRRHIDQFHNTNAQWLCQHPGCRMAFDWQTAYQIHLRNEHGGSQMRMDEAKVVLCPQTVFACGYEGCHHVLEAANDAGAGATWKAYTAHLIKHCEEGRGAGGWDYSHRLRNLLSQSRVAAAWKAAGPGADGLRWDPGASRTLRKLLETRHLDNLPRLLSGLLLLAADPRAKLDLDLPVKKLCPAAAIKHEMRSSPPPPPASSSSASSAAAAAAASADPEHRPGLGLGADMYKIPEAELAPAYHHGVGAESPRPTHHIAVGAPFRTSATAAPDGYGGHHPNGGSSNNNNEHDEDDGKNNNSSGSGNNAGAPMTPPQAFYGMLGTGVYQQQYVAFRPGRAPNACAVGPEPSVMLAGAAAAIPRGQHDGWADVYGPTGLQSPALTDAYYDMSSPLAPAHQAMLAAYGPSHAPS